jgi:hypothetical protein
MHCGGPQIFRSFRKWADLNGLVESSHAPVFAPDADYSRSFLDALTFIKLCFSPTSAFAAENLFLREQLGLFIEQKAKPRRVTDAIRFTLARLSSFRLAECPHHRQTRYLDPLASPRLPFVLEA